MAWTWESGEGESEGRRYVSRHNRFLKKTPLHRIDAVDVVAGLRFRLTSLMGNVQKRREKQEAEKEVEAGKKEFIAMGDGTAGNGG